MYEITASTGKYSEDIEDVRRDDGAIVGPEWWESLNATYDRVSLKKLSDYPYSQTILTGEDVPTEARSILELCDQCQAEGPGKWSIDLRDATPECEWRGEISVYQSGRVFLKFYWTPWKTSAYLSGHQVL